MENIPVYKCRLCLNSTSKKVDIFKQDFPKMIELLSGLKVDPNDGFPKASCLDCAKDVKFCMSVRKQILQSHKSLLKELLESEANNVKISEDPRTRSGRQKITPRRPTRKKRDITPDSTTTEEDISQNNYSDYSDSDDEPVQRNVEQITLIHEPEMLDVKSEEIELKTEVVGEQLPVEPMSIAEPLPVIEPPSVTEPLSNFLSPQRLLEKRNMIAASNKLLHHRDRRYSNVIFIRKSMKDNLKNRAINDTNQNIPKSKKENSDDSNVIWKNGKKYAACDICKREVKLHYLKYHMTIHFPEHFSCDICGVTTRNLRGLRYHKLYWHSSKLDYICDKCGKKYRSKHALDLHNKKEHGGIRDLECNICGKKFFQKMHLKRHVDGIHKKLRPHKCEYCGKDFTKRTHLVTHWRTHTNETPYACDMCGERFKLKLSLKNHLRRVHNYEEKERVFCEVCNRGFASEQGLRAHINSRVHEGEKCQYCSESFTPEYLKEHLREVHYHVDFF